MKKHIENASKWVNRGGPAPTDYDEFYSWLEEIAGEVEQGEMAAQTLNDLQDAFGDALSPKTLQGISLRKPRGYAGDFEVIDRVYQRSLTTNPDLIKWDNLFLNTQAAHAVRNRKTYFIELINSVVENTEGDHVEVLNVASGPARDVFEFFNQHKEGPHHAKQVKFDCVEFDEVAILYAQTLCFEYMKHINFMKANAFRFTTEKRFPLIWSAGLFDYLDDRRFIFLTKRLYEFVDEGGELVIGNFSDYNPSRPYMEVLMDWRLNHRGPDVLTQLALDSGVPEHLIHIGNEPEQINLFLHLKK